MRELSALFWVFLRLGLTSFGGPIAHLGYFRQEFVERRAWLTDAQYSELVALCQFMPGPASSQVGMAIGYQRAGYLGSVVAFLGFTVPSVVVLIAVALGLASVQADWVTGLIHGLKIVAVVVIAQALLGMSKTQLTDKSRITLMVLSACWVLWMPTAWAQIMLISVAGLVGWRLFSTTHQSILTEPAMAPVTATASRSTLWLGLFFTLLLALPILAWLTNHPMLAFVDVFYRAGSLVFGGGHVVLPLLQADLVPTGMVTEAEFLTGYGAAQAVPGPLFTFAAFLGTASSSGFGGILGGLLATFFIFLPSFLLVFALLPVWHRLRAQEWAQGALQGINASVIGLLLAAWLQPVIISSITSIYDVIFALLAGLLLIGWRAPAWLVVLLCAAIGALWF